MTPPIKRSTAIPLVIGILCILGIGMLAATIQTAQPIGADDEQTFIDPPTAGGEVGAGTDIEGDPNETEEGSAFDESEYSTITACIPFLDSTLGVLAVAVGFLVFMALLYVRFNFALTILVGWTVLPPVMLVYFLMTDCGGDGQSFGSPGEGTGLAGTAGETLVPATEMPVWLMGLLVGTVIVGASVLLYRSAKNEDVVLPEETGEEEDLDLDSFARAAGRAADRIEEHNQDVDNAVYKAWIEMTGMLDVENPETYTSREFAQVAIDIGMAANDVEELTELFNDVRYGGKDPEGSEERAIDVLRNIESEYARDVDLDELEQDPFDETDNGRERTNDESAEDSGGE